MSRPVKISRKKLEEIRKRIESTEPEPFIVKNSTMTFGKKLVTFLGFAGLIAFLINAAPFLGMALFKYIPF